jgi:hypothetical protein
MEPETCIWCGRTIRGDKIGTSYCCRKCQIDDLGRKGAEKDNQKATESAALGCLIMIIGAIVYIVYNVIKK